MSEELLQTQTMADLEEHFDDANPWNIVTDYMEKKTILTLKIEGSAYDNESSSQTEYKGTVKIIYIDGKAYFDVSMTKVWKSPKMDFSCPNKYKILV